MTYPGDRSALSFKGIGLPKWASGLCNLLRSRQDVRTIESLHRALQARDAVIAEQAAALLQSRKIFDRSSAAARLGVWQCRLPDNTLEWTDVVYDIFDLPRGSALDRDETVKCYVGNSLEELIKRRSAAIAARGGFTLDAEIVTAKGNHRWIRITATVECEDGEPVRIFGIKQDITEEKIMQDRTRYLASFDVMTGLANRAQFQTRLQDICSAYDGGAASAALILLDLDGFKQLNDTFGHAAGDDCLKETATHLDQVCGGASLIARIGGDEFAVLLSPFTDNGRVCALAREIVGRLHRRVTIGGRSVQIGASAGVAFLDDPSPSVLFKNADVALYEAKAAGRNTFQVFQPLNAEPQPSSAA